MPLFWHKLERIHTLVSYMFLLVFWLWISDMIFSCIVCLRIRFLISLASPHRFPIPHSDASFMLRFASWIFLIKTSSKFSPIRYFIYCWVPEQILAKIHRHSDLMYTFSYTYACINMYLKFSDFISISMVSILSFLVR